jgi:hypothetical protein
LIAGAMMVPDTNSPGTIRIVIVTTGIISGSGPVASVRFDKKGASSGSILSLNAKLINLKGVSLPVQTQVKNPAAVPDSVSTANGQVALGQSGVNASPETGGSTLQAPTPEASPDPALPGENGMREFPPATESQSEPKEPHPQVPAVATEKKFIVYNSVLERFRDYKGEKSVKSLVDLFTMETMPGINQEPAIALSDGKSIVKVAVRVSASGNVAPNFSLKGAKLISIMMDGDTWVIEALPDRNVYLATLTILNNGSMVEVPLTVSPLINSKIFTTGTLNVAEFNLFLNERGTEKAPRFDLNGDGVRNYIDDYIITANFIVRHDSSNKPATRLSSGNGLFPPWRRQSTVRIGNR